MCDYCSWIKSALEKAKVKEKGKVPEKKPPVIEPVIVVHGGAGRIPKIEREFMIAEVKNAAKEAYLKLIEGMPAIDAVVLAISHMESKKYFNCAKGGSRDVNGEIVMDAAIMDNNLKIGCVGAVRDIEHPITLAKAVLEKSDHVLIVERGAQRFALSMGIPALSPGWLLSCDTPSPKLYSQDYEDENEECESWSNSDSEIKGDIILQSIEDEKVPSELGKKNLAQCVVRRLAKQEEERRKELELAAKDPTYLEVSAVGAVVYDKESKFVCGTSTAGNQGKLVGSISSIGTVIGCGIFADQNGCISISGDDKKIYAYAPARRCVERLKQNPNFESSLKEVLEEFELETYESNIGAIGLNSAGEPAVLFKSMHFPWAFCRKGWLYYGCLKDEQFSERIGNLGKPLDCKCED